MPDLIIIAPILAPLSVAFLLPFIALISKRLIAVVCLVGMAVSLGALGLAAGPVLLQGKILVYWMGGWTPVTGLAPGINIAIDAWGLFVAITIALVGFLVLLYSIVYMENETGKEAYYILVMLLITGLIGFSLTGDLFNQFVWLEILSFASFALTAFHYQERIAIEGAFKYLITNSVASLFIVVALTLLYGAAGALNLANVAGEFGGTPAEMIALGLLFAGYATKTALVPWHFWLPDAHQVAPAPVSALLSGAVIHVGIYAIGRLLFTLTPQTFNVVVQDIFLGVAAITMLAGGLQMLRQDSTKRILAYSSISQMGYILMGLAIGTPLGLAAAAVHLFNHAMTKTALFFGAGSLQLRAGISHLSEGGQLIRRMPGTFLLMSLAGLSLSGVPLFIGFVSKTMLEEAAVEDGLPWMAAIAVITSIFTFAGIARLLWRVFWGRENGSAQAGVSETKPLALAAMAIPAFLSIFIGIFPQQLLANTAWPTAASLLQPGKYVASILDLNSQLPDVVFVVTPPPALSAWTTWLVSGFVVLSGALLAIYLLQDGEKRFLNFPPLEALSGLLRRWHSGYLMDYVLWNIFSTSILLILFVLFYIKVF